MFRKEDAEKFVEEYIKANNLTGPYTVSDEIIDLAKGVYEAEITDKAETKKYFVYQHGRVLEQ